MLLENFDDIPTSCRFIVFEGPNGSGKTTVLERLRAKYHNRIRFTREPGGSRIGNQIREILLDPGSKLDPKSELFLILADRAEHVESLRTESKPIISDRYYYSTIAFQGSGRELGEEYTAKLCSLAVQGFLPQLVILFDVEPSLGLMRKLKTGALDRFEQEDIAFHSRVRESFLRQARELSEMFFLVKTDELSSDSVYQICDRIIARAFFGDYD
ncbi:MAG: dTMP kinase [Thermoplasmatales archaeon]